MRFIIHFLHDQDFLTEQDKIEGHPQSRMRIGKKSISLMLVVTYTMSVVR